MNISKKIYKNQIIFAVVLLLMSILAVNINQKTYALSGNEFKAGRIIDDAIFYNGNAMNTNEIQNFLNAKVPSCDTNGVQLTTHWYSAAGRYYTRAEWGAINGNPAPYTCLRDYMQSTTTKSADAYCGYTYTGGTKSAAQIINDVSSACGVSQKALLVLLQKEQSLISDDWPWEIQYRSATGYGCPDTAPCDSEYYGFFNQVYNAARQFKRYSIQSDLFNYRAGQTSYIQYNPNPGCGGSNIYLENAATAALYNYTPYQPNISALNNLYGSGDACGAYGNRNFWRLFNDWFGPTIGSLVKTANSDTVYLLDDGKAYVVPNLSILDDFSAFGPVRVTSASEINQYSGSLRLSNLIGRKSSSSLYLVNSNIRLIFSNCNLVIDYGFTCDDSKIIKLSDGAISRLTNGPSVTPAVRSNKSYTVYYMDNGKKRTITTLKDLQRFDLRVNVLSDVYVNRITKGLDIYGPGSLVKTSNSSTVYIVKDQDSLLPFSSFTYTNELGLGSNVRTISSTYSVQGSIKTKIKCNGTNYIATKGILYSVSAGMLINYGFSSEEFIDGGSICNNVIISQTALGQYIKYNNSIFYVEGGQKRAFSSYISYQSAEYCNNSCNYIDVSSYLLSEIPTGLNI